MQEKVDILYEACEYRIRLCQGVEETIELLNKQSYKGAYENIVLIVDGIKWLIDVIKLTSDVQTEAIDVDEVNVFLEESIESFKNKDYRLLTELLEFELLQVLENWGRKMESNLQQYKKVEKI